MDKKLLIDKIVDELKKIKEVKAVVLAGSHASRAARPDSDLDIGLYYSSEAPLDIKKIIIACKNLGAFPNLIVAKLGEWGTWMNGGAWLIIDKQRVDLIYRNIEFVEKTITESVEGRIKTDYFQQPAYGFYSYMYCSETKFNTILYDPFDIVRQLKKKVQVYPQRLKNKIINFFLWDAQFSFSRAEKSAKRSEIYIVAGCFTRIVNDLIQVLYALNETFFISEKKFYSDCKSFTIGPENFLDESQSILTSTGNTGMSLRRMEELINSCMGFAKHIYKPKYLKNLDEVK